MWQRVPDCRASVIKSPTAICAKSVFRLADRRRRWRGAASEAGMRWSVRYWGAQSCRHWYTITPSLYSILLGTFNQWSLWPSMLRLKSSISFKLPIWLSNPPSPTQTTALCSESAGKFKEQLILQLNRLQHGNYYAIELSISLSKQPSSTHSQHTLLK